MLNKKSLLYILPLMATFTLHASDPMSDPFGNDMFKEMMQMQQNMDKIFSKMRDRLGQPSSQSIHPLGSYNVTHANSFIDKNNHYELMTTIPESKENKIDINIKDGIMTIVAKIVKSNKNQTSNSYSSYSSTRMYQQSISIPQDADENSLKVEYKNNKLLVSLEKKKVEKTLPQKTQSTDNLDTNSSEGNTSKEKKIDKEKKKEESVVQPDSTSA